MDAQRGLIVTAAVVFVSFGLYLYFWSTDMPEGDRWIATDGTLGFILYQNENGGWLGKLYDVRESGSFDTPKPLGSGCYFPNGGYFGLSYTSNDLDRANAGTHVRLKPFDPEGEEMEGQIWDAERRTKTLTFRRVE